jgi:hypothetical protein
MIPNHAENPTATQPRAVKPDPARPPADEHPGLLFAGDNHWLFKDRADAYRAAKVDADAVKSVVQWSAWCREHDARLVLVAVPDRGYLLRAGLPGPPLSRAHMTAAYQAMRDAGVEVIDTESIFSEKDCALQDSHMRPSSFRRLAQFVADRIKPVDLGVPPAKVTYRDTMVWEATEMAEQAHVPVIRTADETSCVFFDYTDADKSPLVIMGDSNAFFYDDMHASFSLQLGGILRVLPNTVARADDGAGIESRAAILRGQFRPKLVIWIFNEFALVNRSWRWPPKDAMDTGASNHI